MQRVTEMRMSRCGAGLAVVCGMVVAASSAKAGSIIIDLDQPTLDRWNYPFNQSPGTRPSAPVFGGFADFPGGFHPDFDNRDGQFHVGFATADLVEPGLGVGSYNVISVQVTMMVENNLQFRYDPTFNIWQSYLPEDHPDFIADDTPGRPMEIFGVGFRNGFDALSYQETTSYSPAGPFGKGHRTTYALDFDDADEPRDVSNNMDQQFDPSPFAIGMTDAVAPGDLVPANTTFTFELDVDDPLVQQYLREALDLGKVHFMVASLFPASEDQDGSFPDFYTKENLLVQAGFADAAGLYLEVEIIEQIPGDVNGDGVVNVDDLLIILNNWGPCPDPEDCPADLTEDGQVNVDDLLMVLNNWG